LRGVVAPANAGDDGNADWLNAAIAADSASPPGAAPFDANASEKPESRGASPTAAPHHGGGAHDTAAPAPAPAATPAPVAAGGTDGGAQAPPASSDAEAEELRRLGLRPDIPARVLNNELDLRLIAATDDADYEQTDDDLALRFRCCRHVGKRGWAVSQRAGGKCGGV